MKEYTKKKLYKSFEFLYLKYNKDVSLISVNELCKLSGVSRTTFYSNYTTINDISNEINKKISTNFNYLVTGILNFYFYKKPFYKCEILSELKYLKNDHELTNYCFFKFPFSLIKKLFYDTCTSLNPSIEISQEKDFELSTIISCVETIIYTWKIHNFFESETYILDVIIDTLKKLF